MPFKSFRISMSKCLGCGKEVNGTTNAESGSRPKPGDVTVCLYCGHIMAFGKRLILRELTSAEMRDVAGNKTILAIQQARGKIGMKP